MRIRARKFVIFAVAAALAAANGFAPRHAQASGLAPAETCATNGHHHHDAMGGGGDHRHGSQIAATTCDRDAADAVPGSPLHNCCVASCSTLAVILAGISFDNLLPDADYQLPLGSISIQAALNSDDPPPR